MDSYIAKPIQLEELRKALKLHRADPPAVGEDTGGKEPASEVIDRAALLASVGGDMEPLAELVRLFLDTYPRTLSEVREAVARADPRPLKEPRTTLRGQ